MKTRSPVSMVSQLGVQAWFRKRALLPPRLPSTTRPSDRPNTNVRPALGALADGGVPPDGQFSLVLDDPLACGDRLYREQSHAIGRCRGRKRRPE
jgi:hypothetical protein